MDKSDVEAIVPLSPIQDDMVREGLGAGTVGHLRCDLVGGLDRERLEQAWQRVVSAHPALRTVLVEKGLKNPVQVVLKRARSLAFDGDPIDGLAFEAPLVRPAVRTLEDGRHELILTFHPAMVDADSIGIVARDWLAALADPALPPRVAPPYADFVTWGRRQSRAEGVFAPSSDAGEILGHQSGDAGPTVRREVPLDVHLTARLREAPTQLDAALAVLIAAYTGRPSVRWSVEVSARPVAFAGTVGSFTHPIPVTQAVDPALPLSGWFEEVARTRTSHAQAHVSNRVARVACGMPDRSASLEVGIAAPPLLASLTLPAPFGLSLSVASGALVATFASKHFSPRRVDRILGHLVSILEADPGVTVGSEIARIGPELPHRLAEWNDTARPVPEVPATAALEQRARTEPSALALGDLSFGALDRQAERVANQIRALGAASGTAVALFVSDGPRAVVGMLGILRTGATAVPLDPAWPFPRLCAVLAEVEPAVIVAEEDLEDQLPPSWAQVVHLDGSSDPSPPLPSAATWDGPALVVFGADDDSPGVVLDQRSIAFAVDRLPPPGARLGFLIPTSDPSAPARILAALGSGSCLVWPSSSTLGSIDALRAWVEDQQLTALAAPEALAATIRGAMPVPIQVAGWGPAEAGIAAFDARGTAAALAPSERWLGWPAANVCAWVLDAERRPVAIGDEGVLFVGGPGIASGYWSCPERERQRFVSGPDGGRTFDTGVRARLGDDGGIVLVGVASAVGAGVSGLTHASPTNPREEMLAELWATVLGVEQVGIDDNFFDLGGDSMRCIQVLGRARQHGLHYSLEQLFEHQTVRELARAECVLAPEAAPEVTPLSMVAPADRERLPTDVVDAYPLTALQQGMLFHAELDPESGVYHEVTTSHLRLPFHEASFRAALASLVARHPILRTSFDLTSFGEPLQLVHATAEIPLQITDIRGMSTADQEAAVDRAFAEERHQRIDWTRAPLLRYRIHVRTDDTFQMTMTELHTILDGWSAAQLLTELFEHYGASVRRAPYVPRPMPTVSFADFVASERAAIRSPEHRRFWEEQMAEVTASSLPRFPASFFPPASSGPAIRDVPLPDEVADALRDLARTARVPLKSVYLAAHLRVLATIGNRTDVLTGLVANGRPDDDGGERLLGLFLNTLPFRQRLDGGTWRELVAETFQTEQLASPFRRFPLSEIQKGRTLFDTEFNFTHFHVYSEVAKETEVLRDKAFERNNFTMVTDVNVDAVSSRVRMHLNYDATAILDSQAEAIAGYYAATLAAMAADPNARYEQLSPLSEREQGQILREWNRTDASLPYRTCLHHLVEAQVEATPDAVAVVFDGPSRPTLRFRDLDQRANQLARHLQARGVTAGSLVPVCVERSLEMVVALLGILKAGGAYLPIDPSYPAARIAWILEDSHAPVVLTKAELRDRLGQPAAEVVCLDTSWDAIATHSPAPAETTVTPDDVAYVIYTSGSTGQPKGVANTHAGVCNRLLWMQETYRLSKDTDVVLQKTSFGFDVSVWEFFWPLITGVPVVLAKPDGHKDSAYLVDLIVRERVTTLHFVPPMLRAFLDEPAVPNCLRRVICSGEALPFELQQRFFARSTAELHNLYGPTEAAIDVTSWACERGSTLGVVPIGRPIANLKIYLLDQAMRPVPVGTAAELYIGGVGVARGYHGQPELTRERFVADPFSDRPEARLYRTGDLARHLPDGSIEYLDRLDNQLKIRGFRIELGEIEAVLSRHPDVARVVVTGRPDRSGTKRLVAHLVLSKPVATADLRAFLASRLPDYMVPAAFVVMDAIPLSASGKVDRKALPEPDDERGDPSAVFVAPRTADEATLAGIWSAVLGVERVGVDDNFFSLGGDSIRALTVTARGREAGLAFTLQDLFRFPTVAGLTAHAARGTSPGSPDGGPLSLLPYADRQAIPDGIEDAYPITALQSGLIYHTELSPGTALYHDINTARIRGKLDPVTFRAAVQRLVDRHPILRTSYDLVHYSRPLQLVHREVVADLQFIDLRGLSEDDQRMALARFVEEEKRWRFDWARPSLVRFFVHALDDATFQYSLSLHDSTLDGWSASAMDSELFRIYHALLHGQAIPEGPPLIPYREFVALELEAAESDHARRFWQDHLGEAVRTELPRWPPAPSGEPPRVRFFEVEVPVSLSDGLKALAHTLAVPLKSVLLAAHMVALGVVAGTSDVVTGLEHNGRPERDGAERTLGLFLNTVPFRLVLGDGSWRDVITATYRAETELLPFRRFPMGRLQQELGRGELFEAVFNYTHFHVSRNLTDLTGFEVADSGGVLETHYPFRAEFDRNVQTDHLALSLHFDDRVFDEPQIAAIAGYYLRALQAMVSDVGARARATSLLSETQLRTLDRWNNTAADHPLDVPFHRQFEAQAARTPAAIVAECGSERVTYAALDARANQIARALVARGIGTDALVAILMERGIPFLTTMVAVFKAGGAYLPLDPDHPTERLADIVDRSGAALVIASQALRDRALDAPMVTLADLAPDTLSAEPLPRTSGPRDLAYVIYTSGSTGRPKGAMVEQRGMVNHLHAKRVDLGITAGDVVAQTASQCFDISVWQFLVPLLVGGRVVICPDPIAHDPRRLLAEVEATGVTILETVPSFLRVLLDTFGAIPGSSSRLARLRWIIPTGEELPVELCRRWLAWCPSIPLVNAYGPTECSDDVTHHVVREPPAEDVVRIPIGRPISNTRLYILDDARVRVPPGSPGDLYVGGAGVGRGYLGEPELTRNAFLPDPFTDEPGALLYKTGDRARHRPDGAIEFLGRVDHQVKVRGYRIELGEIDAVLRRHPAVSDAVVAVRKDTGQAQIVGYVVLNGDLPTADLATFAGQSLPAYMIPTAWVVLPVLPLNSNGKIDRRALPAPSASDRGREQIAPRDELELELARIWAEVLEIGDTGVTDDFFALGGHSLTAVRVVAKIEERFGRVLGLATLLAHPTIEALAVHLRAGRPEEGRSLLVPIHAAGTRPPLFVVHPVGGNVLCYVDLARALGEDQPVIAIQSDLAPADDVPTMAAAYLRSIDAFGPRGPIRLAGWSMGGVVAWEIARQIRARGDDVGALVLIDSYPSDGTADDSDLATLAALAADLARTAGVDWTIDPATLAALAPEDRLGHILDRARAAGALPPDIGADRMAQLARTFTANRAAAARYRPPPSDGPALLLAATRSLGEHEATGWETLGKVEVRRIAGDHYSVVRDPAVAAHLAGWLVP